VADRKGGDGPFLFDLPLTQEEGPPGEERPRPEPSRGESEGKRGGHGGTERGDREPSLFDQAVDEAPSRPAARQPVFEPAPLLPDPLLDGVDEAGGVDDELQNDGAPGGRAAPVPASLANRFTAALLDGGILLSAAAVAVVGGFILGVRWQSEDLAPLLLFVLIFTFVYSVVPLAFWGRTPGMALTRTSCRNVDGGPLTFGQTALRWLGGLLTLVLAGLPLLLALPALGGRSLADRLSGSRTVMEGDEILG